MVMSWFRRNPKKAAIHCLILGVFLLYMFLLAEPLFDRFEQIPGEARLLRFTLPHETGNIRYNIDSFLVSTHQIEMNGWAFINGYNSENTNVYVILKSQDNTYIFIATSQLRRDDINKAFKELGLNLSTSGFHCLVPSRKLARGEYTIGLYVTREDIQALQYTDRAIVKSKGDIKKLP